MNTYTPKQLSDILTNHKKWHDDEDEGHVFCNTNAHNNATKSTELCQLSFSVSIMHV